MYEIVPFNFDDEYLREKWNSFVRDNSDCWIFHTHEWQKIVNYAFLASVYSFSVIENDKIVMLVSLVKMPRYDFMDATFGTGGFAFKDGLSIKQKEEIILFTMPAIKLLLSKLKAKGLRMQWPPLSRDGGEEAQSLTILQRFQDISTNTIIIDTTQHREDLYKGMNATRRNEVRKAEKNGVTITEANCLDDIKDYYRLHVDTYLKTGVYPHPYQYFEAIWNYFKPIGLCKFFLAKKDGKLIAADNIAIYKNKSLYWTACSSEESMKTGASKLLQWKIIEWAHDNGITEHEVGEVFPDAPKGDKRHGLTEFKQTFGGKLRKFHKGWYDCGTN